MTRSEDHQKYKETFAERISNNARPSRTDSRVTFLLDDNNSSSNELSKELTTTDNEVSFSKKYKTKFAFV